MFGEQLHPTETETIREMLEPYEGYRNQTKWGNPCFLKTSGLVLEPSAGNGAILDYLHEKLKVDKNSIHAVEIDPELRFMLQGKGYRVVGSDFEQFDDQIRYGLIVMNPPFKVGARHVLHAWELLDDGGDLVSLVNQETLENPYSQERKALVQLIEQYGSWKSLGQCFKHSRNPTDVTVAMIRLARPEAASRIDFSSIKFDVDPDTFEEEYRTNPLAIADQLLELEHRYKACRQAVVQRDKHQRELDFFLKGIPDVIYQSLPDSEERRRGDRNGKDNAEDSLENETSLDLQIAVLKSRFWHEVFNRTGLGKKATSHFRTKFAEFARQQSAMSFTAENIREVLDMFFLNRVEIMQDCLIAVFDKATAYHEKNCIHKEGWKTNKAYRLNWRVIMPRTVEYDARWPSIAWPFKWERREFFDDLDKVMYWLSATEPNPSAVGTADAIAEHCCKANDKKIDYTQGGESHWFKFRMFQKGTLHLDFKDPALLNDFNRKVAIGKKWIGGGY